MTPRETDPAGPVIVSLTDFNLGNSVYPHMVTKSAWHYNKDMDYPYEKLGQEPFKPIPVPLYLFHFFDQGSPEFREENYRNRIVDAFEFLLEHHGGGVPKTKTPAKTNGF